MTIGVLIRADAAFLVSIMMQPSTLQPAGHVP